MEAIDRWRKSSYSGNGGGNCVEVASADAVRVRDTKDRAGAVLSFDAETWRKFIKSIVKLQGSEQSQRRSWVASAGGPGPPRDTSSRGGLPLCYRTVSLTRGAVFTTPNVRYL